MLMHQLNVPRHCVRIVCLHAICSIYWLVLGNPFWNTWGLKPMRSLLAFLLGHGKAVSNARWPWMMGIIITLTHWGRVTHICISKQTIIGSDNGLSPDRRQAIIWTNAGILLIGPLGTKFDEILFEIHTFSVKEMHLKMSSGKWRPFCLGLNVLTHLALDDVAVILKVLFSYSCYRLIS